MPALITSIHYCTIGPSPCYWVINKNIKYNPGRKKSLYFEMIQLENPKESYTVHFQTYKITITK